MSPSPTRPHKARHFFLSFLKPLRSRQLVHGPCRCQLASCQYVVMGIEVVVSFWLRMGPHCMVGQSMYCGLMLGVTHDCGLCCIPPVEGCTTGW